MQQVEGPDLQSLDLGQQLHVLHFIVGDDLKAVLIVLPEDTASWRQLPRDTLTMMLTVTGVVVEMFVPGCAELHDALQLPLQSDLDHLLHRPTLDWV